MRNQRVNLASSPSSKDLGRGWESSETGATPSFVRRVRELAFFRRPPADFAAALVGCELRGEGVRVRITEVEAYGDASDGASHARFGPSPRSAVMFGPPGRLYVYLCYGIHRMVNIVSGDAGSAAATLIRSVELIGDPALALARRGQHTRRLRPSLGAGPGKVGQILDAQLDWTGAILVRGAPLSLWAPQDPPRLRRGPRVGIDFAPAADRRRAWRFADADSAAVTQPKSLGAVPTRRS